MKKRRAHVIIEGTVQGVFYRASTRDKAQELGLYGWVRNRPDFSVEAVFEGDTETIEKILDWCRNGPPGAFVSNVLVTYEDHTGEFSDFTVVY